MIDVVIYTDGACSPNPGRGGWGAVLVHASGVEVELVGGERETTNNRMEVFAAIAALEHLPRPHRVRLHTDSRYLRDGITQWILGWRSRGWRTSTGDPVKNEDLWRRLDAAARRHRVEWVWIRGHDGDPGNERADALARTGRGALGWSRAESTGMSVPFNSPRLVRSAGR